VRLCQRAWSIGTIKRHDDEHPLYKTPHGLTNYHEPHTASVVEGYGRVLVVAVDVRPSVFTRSSICVK
jgi:hypothetical protein